MTTRLPSRVSKPSCARRKQPELKSKQPQISIYRPNVTWIHGLIRLLLLIAGGLIVAHIIVCLYPEIKIPRSILADLCSIMLTILTGRSNALLVIRLYQRYAPASVRLRCAMTPSCSEYAVLAIRRHGLLRGAWMAYCRLRYRCDGTPIVDFP